MKISNIQVWFQVILWREIIRHGRKSSNPSDWLRNRFKNWWYFMAIVGSIFFMVFGSWSLLSYSEMLKNRYLAEKSKASNWTIRIRGIVDQNEKIKILLEKFHKDIVWHFSQTFFIGLSEAQEDFNKKLSGRVLNSNEPIISDLGLIWPKKATENEKEIYLKKILDDSIGLIVSESELEKLQIEDLNSNSIILKTQVPEGTLPIYAIIKNSPDDESSYMGRKAFLTIKEDRANFSLLEFRFPSGFDDVDKNKLKSLIEDLTKETIVTSTIDLHSYLIDLGGTSFSKRDFIENLGLWVHEITAKMKVSEPIIISPKGYQTSNKQNDFYSECWIFFKKHVQNIPFVNEITSQLKKLDAIIDKGSIMKIESLERQADITDRLIKRLCFFIVIISAILLGLTVWMDTYKKLHSIGIIRAFGGGIWLESLLPLLIWLILFYLVFLALTSAISPLFQWSFRSALVNNASVLFIHIGVLILVILIRMLMYANSSIWDLIHHFD